MPSTEVERLEGEDKTNSDYVQFQWNSAGLTLENWQMAHFRVLGNDKYVPYGTSCLEPARRIWRQLTLLEDAMMAYRIVRAPDRRVFKIDVGSIPADEVEQYMQKVMTQMKRNQVIDENTGRVDLRYNPLSIEEDYFIPVRGATSSDVTALPGGSYTGDIDDVKYLRDKLFSALKVPASYLTNAEGADEDKTTLAQKDIRFARTIQRLQRAVVSELEKVGIIHLHSMGFKGDDLLSFKLSLNNPSKIAELQELEHWSTKFDVAANATDGFFSRRWIAKNVFSMSEDDFLRNQRELFYDRKYDATLQATADATAESVASSMGAGGAGGGIPGMPPEMEGPSGPGPDLSPEEPEPEEPAPEEEAGAEEGEGELLTTTPEGAAEGGGEDAAPPGRREDGWYSPRSKGKMYFPVKVDGRQAGARKRNYKSIGTPEISRRTIYPGYAGATGLRSLAKGLFEDDEPIYNSAELLEEKNLFMSEKEVHLLVDGLNKMESDRDET